MKDNLPALKAATSEIVFYRTEDEQTRIEVRLVNETVWLSLNQMAELFQRDKSVISRHIQNIFGEGELERSATVAYFATVQQEGERELLRNMQQLHVTASVKRSLTVQHEGELSPEATIKDHLIVQADGSVIKEGLIAAIDGKDYRTSLCRE
jgi:hypothetical protein